MDPEHDAYKQIEATVSESLLPQEYEMKYVAMCESEVHNNKPAMLLSRVINAAWLW